MAILNNQRVNILGFSDEIHRLFDGDLTPQKSAGEIPFEPRKT